MASCWILLQLQRGSLCSVSDSIAVALDMCLSVCQRLKNSFHQAVISWPVQRYGSPSTNLTRECACLGTLVRHSAQQACKDQQTSVDTPLKPVGSKMQSANTIQATHNPDSTKQFIKSHNSGGQPGVRDGQAAANLAKVPSQTQTKMQNKTETNPATDNSRKAAPKTTGSTSGRKGAPAFDNSTWSGSYTSGKDASEMVTTQTALPCCS